MQQTRKRAVPAPTFELLCSVKTFRARCTILYAMSYMAKKSCFFTKQLSYALQFCGFKSRIQSCPFFSVPSSSTSTSA